jgi:putative endonuclease
MVWHPEVDYPKPVAGFVWVYVLQSADGSLYIGSSSDVRERCRKHRLGMGSKHTAEHANPRLVFFDGPFSLPKAVARERQLKGWSRAKKDAIIRKDLDLLRALARSRD